MGTIKKVAVIAAVSLMVVLSSVEAPAEKRIGVLLFSGETRYREAEQGIKDKLAEAGYGEPKTVFITENAAGNKTKAAELAGQFKAQKVDLLATMGTHATLAASNGIKDVPIVFSVVYDPVESGITKTWQSSGNNTTGVSSKVSMSKLMEILIALKPIKRLAVLFAPEEKNSVSQLGDLRKLQTHSQARYTFTVIPVSVSKIEDIHKLLPEVLKTADAIYITGSNLVDSQISVIVDMATKAKVITVSHLDDLIVKGVLLGVCANSYSMGQVAGSMGVSILNGASPSSLPIEFATKSDVMLNMKTVKQGQFRVPHDLMKMVTKKIE